MIVSISDTGATVHREPRCCEAFCANCLTCLACAPHGEACPKAAIVSTGHVWSMTSLELTIYDASVPVPAALAGE